MELYTFDIEAPVTNAKKPFYDKKRNFLYFRSPIKYNYYIECSQYNADTNDKEFYLILSNESISEHCRKLRRDCYGRYKAILHNDFKNYVMSETDARGNIIVSYVESKDMYDIYKVI